VRLALLLLVACSGKDHMTSEAMQKPADDKPVVDKKAACEASTKGPCKVDGTRCEFPADCRDNTCKSAEPARCR
jgi:hypothetical protein